MKLGSNGEDQVCSFRKIPKRLRYTNFCTTSARFAPSFVRQPNGTKCTKIVQNATKHELRSQRGQSECACCEKFWCDFVAWTFAPVRPILHWVLYGNYKVPNAQIVQHTPKHEFRSQQGQSGAFVAKNSDTTSSHELLHHFGPFCTEFCKATKQSQMQPNSTKHTKICV